MLHGTPVMLCFVYFDTDYTYPSSSRFLLMHRDLFCYDRLVTLSSRVQLRGCAQPESVPLGSVPGTTSVLVSILAASVISMSPFGRLASTSFVSHSYSAASRCVPSFASEPMSGLRCDAYTRCLAFVLLQ